jgi:hypothetical protein
LNSTFVNGQPTTPIHGYKEQSLISKNRRIKGVVSFHGNLVGKENSQGGRHNSVSQVRGNSREINPLTFNANIANRITSLQNKEKKLAYPNKENSLLK